MRSSTTVNQLGQTLPWSNYLRLTVYHTDIEVVQQLLGPTISERDWWRHYVCVHVQVSSRSSPSSCSVQTTATLPLAGQCQCSAQHLSSSFSMASSASWLSATPSWRGCRARVPSSVRTSKRAATAAAATSAARITLSTAPTLNSIEIRREQVVTVQ